MADKLRVGVIGRTGKGNYGHGLDAVWADVPRCEVVAVADEHEAGRLEAKKRTKAANAYADYREMLDKEKLDLVAVAPRWIDLHRTMAIAAAEHGCHIYMEKPFVPTLAQADEVIRACEMRHIKLALSHQTHYTPTNAVVQKLIAAGEIGDVLEFRGRGKEDTRGGAEDTWVLGSHILDLMRMFSGDATSCFATVTSKGQPISAADVIEGNEGLGPLAGDAVHARYSFANGVVGTFDSVRAKAGTPSRFALQILGSRGVIELTTGYLASVWLLKDGGWSPGRSGAKWQPVTSQGVGVPETMKGEGLHAGNVAAVHDLLDAIDKDRQPLCSMYAGRAVVEMIAAIFESQRVGGPVPLPLARRDNPLTALK
ncbi:MAG: Gfo/Idh/MocA family oxidoreductase [Planctomycetota bacterium]